MGDGGEGRRMNLVLDLLLDTIKGGGGDKANPDKLNDSHLSAFLSSGVGSDKYDFQLCILDHLFFLGLPRWGRGRTRQWWVEIFIWIEKRK